MHSEWVCVHTTTKVAKVECDEAGYEAADDGRSNRLSGTAFAIIVLLCFTCHTTPLSTPIRHGEKSHASFVFYFVSTSNCAGGECLEHHYKGQERALNCILLWFDYTIRHVVDTAQFVATRHGGRCDC